MLSSYFWSNSRICGRIWGLVSIYSLGSLPFLRAFEVMIFAKFFKFRLWNCARIVFSISVTAAESCLFILALIALVSVSMKFSLWRLCVGSVRSSFSSAVGTCVLVSFTSSGSVSEGSIRSQLSRVLPCTLFPLLLNRACVPHRLSGIRFLPGVFMCSLSTFVSGFFSQRVPSRLIDLVHHYLLSEVLVAVWRFLLLLWVVMVLLVRGDICLVGRFSRV